MKSLFLALAFVLAVGIAVAQIKPNRQAGDYIAAAYNYDVDSVSGSGLGGPYTFTQAACTQALPFANSRNLNPFNTNASVLVQDTTQANTETVAFISLSTSSGYCVLQLAVTKPHISYHIRSGTFGLQEAINDATATGGGNVVVDTQWGGTTAMITNAAGNSNVSVSDNRTGTVLYVWNGSNYVPGGGGGGTPGGSPNQIQANLSGAFGGIPYGVLGQVLTSNGNGALATFQPVSPGNLPSQLGATPGSVLNTNGTAASWQAKPVCDTRDVFGADLGAQINACDAQLGATPGEIWATGGGAVTTQVVVSGGHVLRVFPSVLTNAFAQRVPLILLKDHSRLICQSWDAIIQESSNAANTIPVIVAPFNNGTANENLAAASTDITTEGCHFQGANPNAGTSFAGAISLGNCTNCKVLRPWFDGIQSIGLEIGSTSSGGNFADSVEAAGGKVNGNQAVGIAVINGKNLDIHDWSFRLPGNGSAASIDVEPNLATDYAQTINIHDNTMDFTDAAFSASYFCITLQSGASNREHQGNVKVYNNNCTGGTLAQGTGGITNGITAVGSGGVVYNPEIYGNTIQHSIQGAIVLSNTVGAVVRNNKVICGLNFIVPPVYAIWLEGGDTDSKVFGDVVAPDSSCPGIAWPNNSVSTLGESGASNARNIFWDNQAAGGVTVIGTGSYNLDYQDLAGYKTISAKGLGITAPVTGGLAVTTIPAPANLLQLGSQSGSLASATYFWKVTGVNQFGETTPSNETTLLVNASSAVRLSWDPIPGVTSYNLYRGTVTNTEILCVTGIVDTIFLDPGGQSCSGALPVANTTAGIQVSNLTVSLPVCTDASKNFSSTCTTPFTTLFATPPPLGSSTPNVVHATTLDATSGITAISDGVHAGITSVLGNTTAPSIPSNSFGFIGPNSASFTSYFIQCPSTAPAANTVMLLQAPSSNVSACTFVLALATPTPAPGTTITLAAPKGVAICTGTCTVTIPVPAAGYEFCVYNDDNVATVITLAALGSSARYENTARTAYGTAGTGTFTSGGAAADGICIKGRDATHYLTTSSSGTWTAH